MSFLNPKQIAAVFMALLLSAVYAVDVFATPRSQQSATVTLTLQEQEAEKEIMEAVNEDGSVDKAKIAAVQ